MNHLWKYFKGYRVVSVLGPAFKLIEAVLELFIPLIVARIIDQAIPSGDQGQLMRWVAWMIGLGLIGFVLAISAQYFSAKAATGVTKAITADAFEHALNLSKTDRDRLGSASLINRIASDTFQIQTGLNLFLRLFLRSPFIVFGCLLMAIQINRTLSLWFLGMIIVLSLIVFMIMRAASPLLSSIRVTFDKLVTQAREQIQGIRVIKAFNQQRREINAFKETNEELTQTQLLVGRVNALSNPLTFLTVNFVLIGMIWQGGVQVSIGTLTQGQLVALINYLLSILTELVKLAMILEVMNKSVTSGKRVNQLFDITEEPRHEVIGEPSEPMPEDTVIDIENVHFTYPNANAPALTDIDLTIPNGSFIGVIGSTGSGKSTLLHLLTQTYTPDNGFINYHPEIFTEQTPTGIRSQIAVVSGQVSLFKGTIRSNLEMGNEQITDDELWEVLEHAQAKEFVEALPEGLESPVAAFGTNFSGGQRQRLTIARALAKNTPVIVFDDSTSALDYVTEVNFQDALKTHYHDRTIIMITQRIRSLKNADLITVFDQGQQVGTGTHQELLEHNEIYQEIHASQTVAEVG